MSDKQKITLLYLYPNEMNIYGDIGNVRTLAKRLEWRGYEAEIIYHHPGKEFTYEPDIIVGGGGQDSGQLKVANDLQHIGYKLHALATDGTPMLMICGMYQLFGRKFITSDNQELPGIRVFNMETRATEQRLIGPLVLDTKFGEVVGYENHSGQTILGTGQEPFGKVKKGFGIRQNKSSKALSRTMSMAATCTGRYCPRIRSSRMSCCESGLRDVMAKLS
jgi:lipid II isoglutaminyl synthase (glutamine-hydrolysing)